MPDWQTNLPTNRPAYRQTDSRVARTICIIRTNALIRTQKRNWHRHRLGILKSPLRYIFASVHSFLSIQILKVATGYLCLDQWSFFLIQFILFLSIQILKVATGYLCLDQWSLFIVINFALRGRSSPGPSSEKLGPGVINFMGPLKITSKSNHLKIFETKYSLGTSSLSS